MEDNGKKSTVSIPAMEPYVLVPGELARAASRLGDADVNIEYAYCGVDPSSNTPVIIFGVAEAGQAARILDRTEAVA